MKTKLTKAYIRAAAKLAYVIEAETPFDYENGLREIADTALPESRTEADIKAFVAEYGWINASVHKHLGIDKAKY